MKITGLSTRLIAIDPSARLRDRKLPVPVAPKPWLFPLFTLQTDAGIEGYSMGYGPHGDGAALAAIAREVYFPELLGEDPLATEHLWQKLRCKQRHLYNQTETLLGVLDVALWDLKGRALGQSVQQLLGPDRDKLPCYQTAHSEAWDETEVAAEASRVRDAGLHGYKLQLRDGPARDLPRLRAARAALGDSFPLMQDSNAAYSFADALEVGRGLDALGCAWFEEPIRERQLARMRELQRSLRTPLLVGETLSFDELHQCLGDGAFSLVRGDVLIKGGITGLRKLLAAAEVFGVDLEIHAANVPLLDVAQLHVAGASANTRFIELHHPIFRFGVKSHPLNIANLAAGHAIVPTTPGLGVELDWNWIENHTVAAPP